MLTLVVYTKFILQYSSLNSKACYSSIPSGRGWRTAI